MRFALNGKRADVEAPPLKRLLDVLREDCSLTGTKEVRHYGSEHGEQLYANISQGEGWKEDLLVCIKPERWLTVDYSKLGLASE